MHLARTADDDMYVHLIKTAGDGGDDMCTLFRRLVVMMMMMCAPV